MISYRKRYSSDLAERCLWYGTDKTGNSLDKTTAISGGLGYILTTQLREQLRHPSQLYAISLITLIRRNFVFKDLMRRNNDANDKTYIGSPSLITYGTTLGASYKVLMSAHLVYGSRGIKYICNSPAWRQLYKQAGILWRSGAPANLLGSGATG